MRTVLYDDESMEAITVIDVPHWALKRLHSGMPIRFPVIEPLRRPILAEAMFPEIGEHKLVTIWFEQFCRKGINHWFCFTRDSENALRLRPLFLAGQQEEVQRLEQQAFLDGMIAALMKL